MGLAERQEHSDRRTGECTVSLALILAGSYGFAPVGAGHVWTGPDFMTPTGIEPCEAVLYVDLRRVYHHTTVDAPCMFA